MLQYLTAGKYYSEHPHNQPHTKDCVAKAPKSG
jgi:hypothetical protein